MKMAYTPQWYIEGRVIQTQKNDRLTPELHTAQDTLINHLLNKSEMVQSHLMIDCSDAGFPILHKQDWLKNPRLGWVVIYGVEKPLLRWGIAVILQLQGVRYRIVDTLADAVEHLQAVDITLRKVVPVPERKISVA